MAGWSERPRYVRRHVRCGQIQLHETDCSAVVAAHHREFPEQRPSLGRSGVDLRKHLTDDLGGRVRWQFVAAFCRGDLGGEGVN